MILFSSMQIMEKILLSPKKTGLHGDVLRILYLHLDPILPVPRVQMLSVCAEYFYLCFIGLSFYNYLYFIF